MANIITACRIVLSFAILFFYTFSPEFYVLYFLAGLTDIFDGLVARKTDTVSDFGSKLDTVADFCFVAVCVIKFLPLFVIPTWLYVWIGAIAFVKFTGITCHYIKCKSLVAKHTLMNKITGLLMFTFPFTLNIIDFKISVAVLSFTASIAAIQEGYLIIKNTFFEDNS